MSCKKELKNKNISVIHPKKVNVKLAGGNLYRIEKFPSKFIASRNVDVWLPDNYSNKNKYAVLYMHDGQMLFDSTTTWNHQEWKVDEILSKLQADKKIRNTIVVAIWNIKNSRFTDYYPKKAFELLPQKFKDSIVSRYKKDYDFSKIQSDNYLKFIVKELKPYIDNHYSVFSNAANTFIAGSSMGGLISMYAICEYPKVFSGAACMSTHWIGFWQDHIDKRVPDAFFNYMKNNLPSPKNHKIYFDYGTKTLDQFYLPFQDEVTKILEAKGFDNSNFKNLKFEGHSHMEISWSQRFQIPAEFLLKE